MKTQADPRTQSAFSPTALAERTLHRRAIEAVIWGMPAMRRRKSVSAPSGAGSMRIPVNAVYRPRGREAAMNQVSSDPTSAGTFSMFSTNTAVTSTSYSIVMTRGF